MTALLFIVLPVALFNFSTQDFLKDIPKSQSTLEIAADSSFSNKTQSFNAGQTIYIRVTCDFGGDDKKVLNVRDNSYNLLTTYPLSQIQSSPYKFTANFPVPSSAGIYSLEAIIESSGSVANLVQTIDVSGQSKEENSQSKVEVKNKINTQSQVRGEKSSFSPTPDVSPQPTVQAPPEKHKGFLVSIWSKIAGFFKGIFGRG